MGLRSAAFLTFAQDPTQPGQHYFLSMNDKNRVKNFVPFCFNYQKTIKFKSESIKIEKNQISCFGVGFCLFNPRRLRVVIRKCKVPFGHRNLKCIDYRQSDVASS